MLRYLDVLEDEPYHGLGRDFWCLEALERYYDLGVDALVTGCART